MEQFWSAGHGGRRPAHAESLLDRLPQPPRIPTRKRYMLSHAALPTTSPPWLSVAGRVRRRQHQFSSYTQKLYATSEPARIAGRTARTVHYTEARADDTTDLRRRDAQPQQDLRRRNCSLDGHMSARRSTDNQTSTNSRYRGPIQETGASQHLQRRRTSTRATKKRAEKAGWHDQTQSVFCIGRSGVEITTART